MSEIKLGKTYHILLPSHPPDPPLPLRNGLFDEYQEIKSQPPDGTFDHARLAENLAKVGNHWL